VTACLVVLAVVVGMPASARLFSFSHFKTSGLGRGPQMALSLDAMKHTPVREAFEELEEVGRIIYGVLFLVSHGGRKKQLHRTVEPMDVLQLTFPSV